MPERIDIGEYRPAPDDDTIVCRCEEVSRAEIRVAVHDGFFTLAEIRRFLRAGMGLCQGQTCGRSVKALLARELGLDPAAVEPATARSPARPVEMRVLADDLERDDG